MNLRLAGLGYLGAGDPASVYAANTDAAIQQYAQYFTRNSAAIQASFRAAVAARFLPAPAAMSNSSGNCANVSTSNAAIKAGTIVGSAGGAVAQGSIAAGAAAGSVVPVVGTIVGLIGGLISSIFGAHHAHAVLAEAEAICGAVPGANAAFQQIDQGLAAGTLTPAQAAGLYDQIQQQFTAAMKTGTSYKSGDGLWLFDYTNQAIIAARKADGRDGLLTGGLPLPTSAPALPAGSGGALPPGAAGAKGLPPALLYGGGAALLYLLLS